MDRIALFTSLVMVANPVHAQPRGMQIEHRDLRTPHGIVRVHLAGPNDGPVLCFTHGALVAADIWFGLIHLLSDRYRCVAPELPLGSHPIPLDPAADTTPPGVADLVVEVLDALGAQSATLVGNDSGSAIAQLVAARSPARVDRLILTNGDAFEVFPPHAYSYIRLFRYTMLARLVARVIHRFPVLGLLPFTWGPLARQMTTTRIRSWLDPATRTAGIVHDFGKFAADADARHTLDAARALTRFEKPVVVIWGNADAFFSMRLARRIVANVSDGELVEVEGSRTYVMLDAPVELAGAIRERVPTNIAESRLTARHDQ